MSITRPNEPAAAAEMQAEPLWCVTTTVAQAADASALASQVLNLRLAACVQVEALQSHYRWQGQTLAEPEWRLTLKTTAAAGPALLAWLKAHHPYELPQLCWSTWQASADYAQWVHDNVNS
jgi:periplasmic divalent cation tolerance protein